MARPAVPFSRLVDSLGNIAREWRDFLVPAIAEWGPAGNGIVFTSAVGTFVRRGQQVDVYFDVTWPVTGDGSPARVAGFPHPVGARHGGLTVAYTDQGAALSVVAQPNVAYAELFSFGGVRLTNAGLSGKRLIASGTYLL